MVKPSGRETSLLPFFAKIDFFIKKKKDMEEKKEKRGGARSGSGRKKSLEKKITFGATAEVVALLEGKPNKSRIICEAIKAYLK